MITNHKQESVGQRAPGWSLVVGILILFEFFVFQTARAQVLSGAISGTVSDSSGAVLAGATVTVTNRETSVTRSMQTGTDGHYHFSSLGVGFYDVKSEAPGFQSQV